MFGKVFCVGILVTSCLSAQSALAQSVGIPVAPVQSQFQDQSPEVAEIATLESLLQDDEIDYRSEKDLCIAKCTQAYIKELKLMGEQCDAIYAGWYRVLCYKIQGPIRENRYEACKAKCK